MKKTKAVLDFIRMSNAGKVQFYYHAIEQMTGNEYFPTPDVSLADARAAVDALEAAISVAATGDHVAVARLNAQLELTDNLFRTLVAYVNRIADGDEVKVLSSGFHESAPTILPERAVLAVNDGVNNGCVKLVAKAVEKAGAYIWQYAKDLLPANESDWVAAGTSTRASFEIAGLSVATKYYFRMAAVTPNAVTNFCAPVLKIVV